MTKKPPIPTLHPRNQHQGRYDLPQLCRVSPALKPYVQETPAGLKTIDFHDPDAVQALNQALLAKHYQVDFWQIPEGYLCPPIPGRADYIHHLADLISGDPQAPAKGKKVHVLDVGTGASGIYPLIACHSYGWRVTASDIDVTAVRCAETVFQSNKPTRDRAKTVQQTDPSRIFSGVIREQDRFSATLCNPPFFSSAKEALEKNRKKRKSLSQGKTTLKAPRNFGGQSKELWCPGGEVGFIKKMIKESREFAQQVGWFTTLVSRGEHLNLLKKTLAAQGTLDIRVIPMGQGQKISRILAWRFLDSGQ